MAESFGARLRRQREQQQVALTAIAEHTKISVALLEELERDDVTRWPGGIFRRAFIRAYAQDIGLEPDAVAREFMELYPDPNEVIAPPVPDSPNTRGDSARRPPIRLRYLIGSAVESLASRRFLQRREPVVTSPEPSMTAAKRVMTAADGVITPPESVVKAAERINTAAEPVITAPEVVDSPPEPLPEKIAPRPEPDLSAAARLCTELGKMVELREVAPLLESAAKILDAAGLIVWAWDPHELVLTPSLAHGYSDEVLARLPQVRRDTDNATATAFRSVQTRIVIGTDQTKGAVVAPLMTPVGCVGVLAVELRHGDEQRESVRALAAILAAQLAPLVGVASLAETVNA